MIQESIMADGKAGSWRGRDWRRRLGRKEGGGEGGDEMRSEGEAQKGEKKVGL